MGDSPQAGRFFYYTGGVLAKSISQRNLMDCVGDDAHIVPRKWRRQTCPRIASHIVPRICSGAVILCIISSAAVSKPSGGIRSLPSLSAWGLPTPVVVLACIGNVDIQVFFWYRWVTLFCTAFASLHSLGGGGFFRKVISSRAVASKPSGGIRSLPSLSAWGLPTPIVALACIGNVDIQVFFWYRWVTLFCTAFASLHSLGGGGFW